MYSTKGDIEQALDSMFWRDVKHELRKWKKGFEGEMKNIVDDAESDNPSTASVLLHMGDINGRVKAVDYLLNLPDMFLNIIESQKDDVSDN